VSAHDTIVAASSAAGPAARGIVRLSGPHSASIVRAMLAPGQDASFLARAYHAADALLLAEGMTIPARLYVMLAPASYTREDIVEVHAPGAAPILRALIDAMLRLGARPAQPGEFTRRAFLNGRLDLAQAEAVQRIIHARSEAEMRAALSALRGGVSTLARRLSGHITRLCVEVEAGLDFSDQDIEFITPADLAARCRDLAAEIRRAPAPTAGAIHTRLPRVALRGEVNAGKSSLFNALLDADRALVSPVPGVTRDTVEADLDLGPLTIRLIDTAGLRPPAGDIEAEALTRSGQAQAEADLVLFVVDSSSPLAPDVQAAIESVPPARRLVVLNKSDLVSGTSAAPATCGGSPPPAGSQGIPETTGALHVSAITGHGLDELKRQIARRLATGANLAEEGLLLNARHAHALHRAAEALDRAATAAQDGLGMDLAAADLRDALDAVGEITGRVQPADILDRIFSGFCVGK